MTVTLRPIEGELGGVRLGSHRDDILASGIWDESIDEETGHHLDSVVQGISVTLVDDVVVSVTARDECVFSGQNLIGAPLAAVKEILAKGAPTTTFDGEAIKIYELDNIELYVDVAGQIVVQLALSDYSLVDEE